MSATHGRSVPELRAARQAALDCGDLPAQRRRIQELYGSMCDAERRAAATARHYTGMVDPRGHGRPESRVAEARAEAAIERDRWVEAERHYAEARLSALAAAGLVEDGREIPIGQTPEEARAEEALVLMRRDYPPIGWGRSLPTTEERIALWRARPEADRLQDPHPRIPEGEPFRAAHKAGEGP